MKKWIIKQILKAAYKVMNKKPNFVIGDPSDPYMLRWHIIPRNRFVNVYLHKFLKDDDDRALHDHPWVSYSLLLKNCLIEHTILAGGCHKKRILMEGTSKFRSAKYAHRIEVPMDFALTLFITGPIVRDWGFHCPVKGWIPWRKFVSEINGGEIGKGCDD